jgi:hypothetical protein
MRSRRIPFPSMPPEAPQGVLTMDDNFAGLSDRLDSRKALQ